MAGVFRERSFFPKWASADKMSSHIHETNFAPTLILWDRRPSNSAPPKPISGKKVSKKLLP